MFRKVVILTGLFVLLTSCSKDKRIERSIRGAWQATKSSVESIGKRGPDDSSMYKLEVNANGTCEFKKDGTGNCQWEVHHKVKQGSGMVMMETSKEVNQFKWRVENEVLIIEHEKKCHCNNKEERYIIQERYDNMIVLQSETESKVEVNCSSCGGTLREQFKWRLTLQAM